MGGAQTVASAATEGHLPSLLGMTACPLLLAWLYGRRARQEAQAISILYRLCQFETQSPQWCQLWTVSCSHESGPRSVPGAASSLLVDAVSQPVPSHR